MRQANNRKTSLRKNSSDESGFVDSSISSLSSDSRKIEKEIEEQIGTDRFFYYFNDLLSLSCIDFQKLIVKSCPHQSHSPKNNIHWSLI